MLIIFVKEAQNLGTRYLCSFVFWTLYFIHCRGFCPKAKQCINFDEGSEILVSGRICLASELLYFAPEKIMHIYIWCMVHFCSIGMSKLVTIKDTVDGTP